MEEIEAAFCFSVTNKLKFPSERFNLQLRLSIQFELYKDSKWWASNHKLNVLVFPWAFLAFSFWPSKFNSLIFGQI